MSNKRDLSKKTTGTMAEKAFAKQFKATLTDDWELQCKDIDAISAKGSTISIKHHITGARTGNLAFEYNLVDPRGMTRVAGNFLYCEAEYHADLIGDVWYIFKHKELFDWVDSNKSKYRLLSLSMDKQEDNKSWGNGIHIRNEFYLIPIKDIEFLASYKVKAKYLR